MSLLTRLAATAGHADSNIYIEDVFSAYTYTGNGSTQTITNGIDLAGKGGLVWFKKRDGTQSHTLQDSVHGLTKGLASDLTNAETSGFGTSFLSSGFSVPAGDGTNANNVSYVSWSFAQTNKFFKVAQATVSGGVTATVDLSSLGTVGMVAVKRTDSTSAWFVYHRSCTSGKLVYLNTTAAETTDGSVTLSGTTLSLVGGTIANGTYIVYAWAHDTASTGIIQCGSFTTDGSGNMSAPLNLGWEPQLIIYKSISAVVDWYMFDETRGFNNTNSVFLNPNLSNAETATGGDYFRPTATGANGSYFGASNTIIYLAIRRGPMKQPTTGTQVYNAIARTGTGAAATVTGVGFPPDLQIVNERTGTIYGPEAFDRLRGVSKRLYTLATAAEGTETDAILEFTMDGEKLGADAGNGYVNANTYNYINWCFRRYPGVCEEVCYTSPGGSFTTAHNLGAVPELIIIKRRDAARTWVVYHAALGNTYFLHLDTTAAKDNSNDYFSSTTPTSTIVTLNGAYADIGNNTNTAVMYLFATLAGISKCFSFTGNGSSQTINCGFAAGARWILIKRTDSTGDWYCWDSTRGIVAGNDGHLSLNTTAAEVTTDDTIDPDSTGFVVNQVAATNCNVNNATYIGLAFS